MDTEVKLITHEEEFILNKTKADSRVLVNATLIGICFTIFTLIVTIKPQLLIQNTFISLQLVCSIPLLMSSIFARSRQAYTIRENRWNKFGSATFLLGYAFLLNVLGLLLISFVSITVGLVFFFANALLAITYSVIDVSYERSRLQRRITKDMFFIFLIVVLGILPALYN